MKELTDIQVNLKAPKNQTNKFGGYKYRSCEDILEGLKSQLSKHKCYVTLNDDVIEIGGLLMIKATATITNSEDKTVSVTAFAGVDPNKKGMDIAQTFGSSSSYARKYALNGLFAIDDTKDADTQDNTPSKPTAKTQVSTGTNKKTKPSLSLTSPSYSNAFTSYRDAESIGKRNEIKQKVLKAYGNANQVLNKLEKDYKAYLEAKNK
jgi:hypothetical protein